MLKKEKTYILIGLNCPVCFLRIEENGCKSLVHYHWLDHVLIISADDEFYLTLKLYLPYRK